MLSWLLAFGVINRYNRSVSVIGDFLYRVTEPALRPIRAMLPNFGGIDISPVVLILILYFLRILIDEDLAPSCFKSLLSPQGDPHAAALNGRSIAYDLIGPDTAPTVCITHSLASDGGSWAEQVPALLQAGFRVLRIDMRGHGGSDPVPGDYTMSDLAGDVATVLDGLSIPRVHYIGLSIGGMLGQAFALEHGDRLISILWCDTLPASPPGAAEIWGPRVKAVREANSLAPIAEASMDRYLTPAFKTRNPGRWKQIEDTILGTTAQTAISAARRRS
jgi:uncharacterized protein YggT (Ycf19 family)